jgi:hypothetical protein
MSDLGLSMSSTSSVDSYSNDEESDDQTKGALYKRKDFLDKEEEGMI